MIIAGTTQEHSPGSSKEVAKIHARLNRDFGRTGLTADLLEDEVVGYPSDVDSQGNYTFAVEQTKVSTTELKPGDIGYSNSDRFKTSPQLLTREADE